MLPSSSLSKVPGHGHVKKFWLTQNQKESESKTLSASASASPRRNGGNATGLELSYGNVASRTAVRATHASLATCAESLSTRSWSDQSRSQTPPVSFSLSTSIVKQEHPNDNFLKSSVARGGHGHLITDFGERADSCCPTYNYRHHVHDQPFIREDWQPEQAKPSQENWHHMKVSDSVHSESKCHHREVQETSHVIYSKSKSRSLLTSKSFAEDEPSVNDSIGSSPPKHKSSSKQGQVELYASKGPARIDVFGMFSSPDSNTLRACLVCGTTKTPLWRSGPVGPKSLCNACGIRLKKAKRCSELNECLDSSVSNLAITHLVKVASKAGKRKQDTIPVSLELPRSTHLLATQITKKRRESNPMKKGDCAPRELACRRGESLSTLSLPCPAAISSPSLSAFEKLSIGEDSKAMDIMVQNVEEEAAVSLMCLSYGLGF